MGYSLKIGDTVKCQNVDEAFALMQEMKKEDILTDIIYKKDGVNGIWVKVILAKD